MSTTTTIDFTQPRTITVDRTEVLRSGVNKFNRPWTLYRVYASENGVPISEELRSFDALSGDVTITAEAFIKDGAITHYTLKRVKDAASVRERRQQARDALVGSPPAPPDGGDDDRYAALEARITLLEAKFVALKALLPGGDS